jgi:hypothetical protein
MKTLFLILLISIPIFGQCERQNVKGLSDADKTRLFREHMTDVLNKGLPSGPLNEKQRGHVAKGLDILIPDFYVAIQTPGFEQTEFGKKFAVYWSAVKKDFSESDRVFVFESLPNYRPLVKLRSVEDLFVPDCNCSTLWTFCGFDFECSTAQPCIEVILCGPWLSSRCNGVCAIIPPSEIISPSRGI